MLYINGKLTSTDDARIAPNDRGLLLADGLFETIRVYQRTAIALTSHWERLHQGGKCLELPIPLTSREANAIIQQLLAHHQLDDATVRVTVTRGSGLRGLDYPKEINPTIMITVLPPPSTILNQNISITFATLRRNEHSPLSRIKSLAYLDNVLARREATLRGFDEAVLLNTQGFIAEACASNLFLIDNNHTLHTPKINDGALPGITRDHVLTIAKKQNIRVEERSIQPQELRDAKEIFLTNSLIGIQPVANIDGHPLESHITTQLRTHYDTFITHTIEQAC